MATITTAQAGNWSAGATWVGGTPPGTGDIADMDHDVTLTDNRVVDGIDVADGITFTMNDNTELTGLDTNQPNTGTVVVGAGCLVQTTAAGTDIQGTWQVSGTSGNITTFEPTGAGGFGFDFQVTGTSFFEWCNIKSRAGLAAVGARFDECEIDIAGINNTFRGLRFRRCFLTTTTADATVTCDNEPTSFRDIAYGYSRDGTVRASTLGLAWEAMDPVIDMVLNASSLSPSLDASLLTIDNMGFLPTAMLPDTGSALDGAVAGPGIGYANSKPGIYERSTAAKKTGDFGVRLTPKADIVNDFWDRGLEVSAYIPVATGENVSVSVQARRNDGGSGGMTSDAMEIELDPEGAWFTPDISAETLPSADTFAELTATGTNAGGSSDVGAVRIVLRVKEFAASDTGDFADMVVTVGSATYTVGFEEWAQGSPLAVKSVAGSAIAKLGGKIG